jgi:hypothetical protein
MADEVTSTSNTVARNQLLEPSRSYAPKSNFSALNSETTKIIKQDALAGSNDSFKILYQETNGTAKTYLFSLLPAVECGVGQGISGRSQVPEVKPGIAIISAMKQKNIVIPGGVPVAQTIGVESTILQCVGAFVGTEIPNAQNQKVGDLSALYYGYNGAQKGNSEAKAKEFMQKVVQSGRPVTFQLETSYQTKVDSVNSKLESISSVMKYRGLVIAFKYFAQRSNRTYYTLNILVTDYPR